MDDTQKNKLVLMVEERFSDWKTARQEIEKEWATAYYNYLGQYSPAIQGQWRKSEATRPEGSQIFLKVTGNKVRGAVARLYDVYSEPDFALKAEVSDDDMGQGVKLVTAVLRTVGLGSLAEKMASDDRKKKLEAHQEVLDVATEELKGWYRRIDLPTYLGEMVLSAAWSGTGILRSPMSREQISAGYTAEGVVAELTPGPGKEVIEPWCFYPDPQARDAQGGEGFVILHRFTAAELRKNGRALGWDDDAVTKLLEDGPKGEEETWEQSVKDAKKDSAGTTDNRYRVKEYWGLMRVGDLKEEGVEVKVPNVTDDDHVETCVVACGGELLWAKVNPLYPAPYRPVILFQWFPRAGSIWGEGVAASFDDVQRCINGAARMLLDTTAFAANCMFELASDALIPGQDLTTVFPGKKWVLRPGAQGPAIRPVLPPNVTAVCLQAIALFEKWADDRTEVTAQTLGQDAPSQQKTATGQAIQQQNVNALTKGRIERLDNVIETMVSWDYRYMVEVGEAPPLPVTVTVAGTRKASEANVIRTQRITEALGILPNLMTLPAKNPPGSAVENVDNAQLVKMWLDTMELEGVWNEQESPLVPPPGNLPGGQFPGMEGGMPMGLGGGGEGNGMPPGPMLGNGGGIPAGPGAYPAGTPGPSR